MCSSECSKLVLKRFGPFRGETRNRHVCPPGTSRINDHAAQTDGPLEWIALGVDVLDPNVWDDSPNSSQDTSVKEQRIRLDLIPPHSIAEVGVNEEETGDESKSQNGSRGLGQVKPEEDTCEYCGDDGPSEQCHESPDDLDPSIETFHKKLGACQTLE